MIQNSLGLVSILNIIYSYVAEKSCHIKSNNCVTTENKGQSTHCQWQWTYYTGGMSPHKMLRLLTTQPEINYSQVFNIHRLARKMWAW